MPELAGLNLSVSSHVTLDDFQSTGKFEAELTGSSSLSGELEADSASFKVYEAAYVKLAGSTGNLWLDACGNSVTDLSEFEAEDATLDGVAPARSWSKSMGTWTSMQARTRRSIILTDLPRVT